MDRGHKKEYFNVMYTSYKNRHANRDTLLLVYMNKNLLLIIAKLYLSIFVTFLIQFITSF